MGEKEEVLRYDWGRTVTNGDIHNLDASVSGRFQWLGHEQQLIVGLSGYRGRIGGPMYYEVMPEFGPHAIAPGNCAGGSIDSYFGSLPVACWNNGDVPLPTSYQGAYSFFPDLLEFFGPYNDFLTGDYSRWTATQKQYGAYASLRLQPFERLSMILGGRYNRWERQSEWTFYVPEINRPMYPDLEGDWATEPLVDGGLVKPEKKFIPYAGMVFDLTPQMTAYASYTGIYRPNIDNNWIGTPYFRDAEGNALPPVEGDSKEVGVKGAFFDGQLNTQLTVYQMQQKNFPIEDFPTVYVPTPQGDGYMQCTSNGACSYAHTPSPGIRSRGIELSAEGRLGENWNLAASWAHGRLDFKDTVTGQWHPCGTMNGVFWHTQSGGGVCTSNLSFMLPKNQVKLFGTWSHQRLTLGAGAVWKQGTKFYPCQASNCSEESRRPVGFLSGSYAVVDVLARYAISPRVSLSANVGNLFDRKYISSASWGYQDSGYFWGAPRNAMLTFEYKLF
ncbi:MAG: TonB-dependent receptor [Pseudoxanthomonas sp.]